MTKTEIRRKANSEMEKRKLRAELDAQERTDEIYRKFPQVEEIRRMMTKTASELSMAIIRRGDGYRANFEKIRQNNLDCQKMIKNILVSNGYPEDYMEVHYRCSLCNDEGYTDGGMCSCMHRLITAIATEELNKSADLPEADFAHFDLEYQRNVVIAGNDCFRRTAENLEYCQNYAAGFSLRSDNILMVGKTGVGKTHLSMAIAHEVIKLGYNVIYGSVINLLRMVESEHFGRSDSNDDTLKLLFECDLLVIDDLGTEFHTSFSETMLYNIINTRLNTGKPTIISTNLSKTELPSTYNERIISRLVCSYQILEFLGRDVRQMKRLRK